MPAGHAHSHPHAPSNHGRAFAIGMALNLGFVLLETVYGVLAHSVALLADAGHNLSDVLGLAISWGALWLARFPPTRRRTYGLRSSSILAALLNALLLLLVLGGIAWESLRRLAHPEPVGDFTVMAVAGAGIVVNGVTALLFRAGSEHDLNIRSAFLHMAVDALVSLGVVLSALVIHFSGWLWLDPAVSLAIVVVIAAGTWSLLRDSVELSLQAVPPGVDPEGVKAFLHQLPGVLAVHDLHIWAMSTTETALSVHLVRPGAAGDDDFLRGIAHELHERFDVDHPTVQVQQSEEFPRCCSQTGVAPLH